MSLCSAPLRRESPCRLLLVQALVSLDELSPPSPLLTFFPSQSELTPRPKPRAAPRRPPSPHQLREHLHPARGLLGRPAFELKIHAPTRVAIHQPSLTGVASRLHPRLWRAGNSLRRKPVPRNDRSSQRHSAFSCSKPRPSSRRILRQGHQDGGRSCLPACTSILRITDKRVKLLRSYVCREFHTKSDASAPYTSSLLRQVLSRLAFSFVCCLQG